MSRGPGRWQRRIIEALAASPFVYLGGGGRSELTAKLRAAKALEKAGQCAIIRLWDDDHKHICTYATRADFRLSDGQLLKSLSVERVPYGARSTFKGSLRQIAREVGVSASQVRRDLALAEARGYWHANDEEEKT